MDHLLADDCDFRGISDARQSAVNRIKRFWAEPKRQQTRRKPYAHILIEGEVAGQARKLITHSARNVHDTQQSSS